MSENPEVSLTLLRQSYMKLSAENERLLKNGGGGGTSDGMEQRVAKLESQFEKLNEKVDTLRIDVAVLKERVGNLPSKGFIVTATVTSLALIGALSVFGERLLSLIGS